ERLLRSSERSKLRSGSGPPAAGTSRSRIRDTSLWSFDTSVPPRMTCPVRRPSEAAAAPRCCRGGGRIRKVFGQPPCAPAWCLDHIGPLTCYDHAAEQVGRPCSGHC